MIGIWPLNHQTMGVCLVMGMSTLPYQPKSSPCCSQLTRDSLHATKWLSHLRLWENQNPIIWVSHVGAWIALGGGGRFGFVNTIIWIGHIIEQQKFLTIPLSSFKKILKNSLNVPLPISIQIKYYYVGIIFCWMGFDWVRSKNFAERKQNMYSIFNRIEWMLSFGSPKNQAAITAKKTFSNINHLAEWAPN